MNSEANDLDTILTDAVKESTGLPDAEPRPGQRMLTGHLEDSMEQRRHFAGKAPTGSGKALDVDTPIPTIGGWTLMGDLEVGDTVFDEMGRPQKVLSTSDIVEGHPCFAVTFADGSEIVADAEHLWTVVDLATAIEDRRGTVTVTTVAMAQMAAPAVPVPSRGIVIPFPESMALGAWRSVASMGQRIIERDVILTDEFDSIMRAPHGFRSLVVDSLDRATGLRVTSPADVPSVRAAVAPRLAELLISVGRRATPVVSTLGGSFMPLVSILPVESRPVRCITVSSPSSLYLAGPGLVATHNSISYLSPAMLAAASGERTVISTQSLSLQAQIRDKDAPAVATAVEEATGYRPTLAILKGWSNYGCPLAAMDAAAQITSSSWAEIEDALAAVTDRFGSPDAPLVAWVLEQATGAGSGDRAECPLPITDEQWAKVSVSSDECPGRKRCSMGAVCLPGQARAKADEADVVVTNHAMLAVQAARDVPVVLGKRDSRPFDHLVVDEAHTLAGTVRNQGASVLGAARLVSVARRFESTMTELNARGAGPLVTDMFGVADKLDAALARRLGSEKVVKIGMEENPIVDVAATVDDIIAVMQQMLNKNRTGGDRFSGTDLKAMRVQSRLAALREDVRLAADGEFGVARWIQIENTGTPPGGRKWTGASVLLSLIDVAGRLRRNLYAAQERAPGDDDGGDTAVEVGLPLSVSAVSATISQPVVKELGLDAILATYPSPFDEAFARSLLYVPRDDAGALLVKAPGRKRASMDIEAHMSWALDHMASLIEANGGSALVLASTSRAGRLYADALRRRSRGWDVHSTWQDGTKEQTIARWKADHSSVLVGTRGLMTGVDAPGATCTLVVVDRVPRSAPNPPDDERVAQLCRTLGISQWDADRLVYVEDAAMLLEQAAGRLIRSAGDGGVVAVLDPRLHRSYPATYGAQSRERYLAALAGFPRTSKTDVAIGVIAATRALSGAA